MIKFINLTKKYKNKTIINNLNLTLPNKGIVLFKGENGTGKTTLLNCITKRIKYDGEIVFDKDFNFTNDIYYSLSNDSLYDYLTVNEKKDILLNEKEKLLFDEYINKYDLNYLIDRKNSSLSSGERQKIELIFTLSKRRKITIIDEPFEFIDKDSKPLFIEEVLKLSKEVLVIETCHFDIHEADIIVDFNNNLNIVKNNEIDEVINNNLNNEKNHYFKKSFILFSKRPKKRLIIFNVLSFLIISFVFMFLSSISIENEDVLNIFTKNHLNGGIYYNINDDYQTENKLIYKNLMLDKENNVPNTNLLKFKGDFTFYSDTNLIESDYIYINGENIKINDNEIYIPDYIYDTCMVENDSEIDNHVYLDKKTYEIKYSVENSVKNNYYLYHFYKPNKQNKTFNENNIKYEKFDLFNIDYKIKVYDTNYERYLPHSSYENIEERKNDVINYAKNLIYYVNFVYVNKNTNILIHDNFMNIEKSKYHSREYYDYHNLYFKDNLLINNNYNPTLINGNSLQSFEDNNFRMNTRYAKKYLNLDLTINDINKYFDIKIGNKTFKMKLVGYSSNYFDKYEELSLPYNVIKELYDDGFFTNKENFNSTTSLHLIDENKVDLLNFKEFDYMNEDVLVKYLSYKDGVINISKILFITTLLITVFFNILYSYFVLRPEYKISYILLNKNLSKFNFIELEYLPRILIFTLNIILSFGLSKILIDIFMKLIFK